MSDPRRLRVFAGIDEAGLGPILGPLTFGFCAFRSPAEAPHLWEHLQSVVSREARRDRDRVVVADSKVVHSRNPRGRRRLETTALGFLSLLGGDRRPPASGDELLLETPAELAPEPAWMERLPWYARSRRPLPVHQERGALELRVERLAREMRRRGVELLDAGVRVRPAALLNASFERTGNKGETLWLELTPILRRLWIRHAAPGLRTLVDRQGKRMRYGSLLARSLPEASVEIRSETPTLSEYVLTERRTAPGAVPRRMRIAFAERGEERSFAVALGSCLAKYARETAMDAFNDYFGGLQPGLAPPAGYTTDGRPWLGEAEATLRRCGIERELLVRSR